MRQAAFTMLFIMALLLIFMSACTASLTTSTDPFTTTEATAIASANPTSTPANSYTHLSQEEMVILIVEIVDEIEDKFEALNNVTDTVNGDNKMTDTANHETLALLYSIQSEQSNLQQAIEAYTNRFILISPDTGNQLRAIKDRLVVAAIPIDDLISDLDSGIEITLNALDDINEAWMEVELGPSLYTWQELVLAQIDLRETYYMNIQPRAGQVANDRIEAFIQAHDFIQAFLDANEDAIFTTEELAWISQIAANAEASLFNTGDPQLFGYAEAIDRITRLIVRGDWYAADSEMDMLRLSLPARPQP